jgi:hypothetical protein
MLTDAIDYCARIYSLRPERTRKMEGRRLFCFAMQSRSRRRKKSRRPAVAGRRSGHSPYPSARSGRQRTRRVALVETEGRRQGGLTQRRTRVLGLAQHRPHPRRCYRELAGEKEVATFAIRVGSCAAGVAGEDAMEADVTSIVAGPDGTQRSIASLVEIEESEHRCPAYRKTTEPEADRSPRTRVSHRRAIRYHSWSCAATGAGAPAKLRFSCNSRPWLAGGQSNPESDL